MRMRVWNQEGVVERRSEVEGWEATSEGAPFAVFRATENRNLLWLWCSALQFPKLFASRWLHPHTAPGW